MARPRRKPEKEKRPPKKKTSVLITESVTYVDYKDVNLLRRFMSERAKIRSRRVTGNTQQQQREVARAIRVAREMALLPYSVRQVTQRRGGRGRDRDRDRDYTPRDRDDSVMAPISAEVSATEAVIEGSDGTVEVIEAVEIDVEGAEAEGADVETSESGDEGAPAEAASE
jgi:small subunit ribosomal protein S18